jgi:hypothetical protein
MILKMVKSISYLRILNLICLILLSSLTIIPNYNTNSNSFTVFSQSANNNEQENKTNTWISKRNNLNITMSLDPKVPVVDEKTKITFDTRKLLNRSDFFDNLNARVTVTDHDGRLFKFGNQHVINGKFSVEYIFPDDGQHKIILQLYKNTTAFTLASFDIMVPHPHSSNDLFSWLFKSRPF